MKYLRSGINLGLQLIVPAILGLFLGKFIDEKLNLFPLVTFSLLILGIVTGIWSVYKELMRRENET